MKLITLENLNAFWEGVKKRIPSKVSDLTNDAGYLTNVVNITGNAGTATKLATARTINGTSFNGSANITTANWGTARNITIGNTTKSVNGSGNVSWTLSEIGIPTNIKGSVYSGSRTLSKNTWYTVAKIVPPSYAGTSYTVHMDFSGTCTGTNSNMWAFSGVMQGVAIPTTCNNHAKCPSSIIYSQYLGGGRNEYADAFGAVRVALINSTTVEIQIKVGNTITPVLTKGSISLQTALTVSTVETKPDLPAASTAINYWGAFLSSGGNTVFTTVNSLSEAEI